MYFVLGLKSLVMDSTHIYTKMALAAQAAICFKSGFVANEMPTHQEIKAS